ncbi:glycosyltransferase [Psychrobacillus sp. FSL H8-0510]|uniref:glycosyltransferase n=1 Tax=Psychrobacillus sp. FSL H8-0510 TaxID=2921394 RepID=UPI0030FBF872
MKSYPKTNKESIQINYEEFLKNFMVQYKLSNPTSLDVNFTRNWNKEILFITKFPPTIGGVATQEYWRARRLALSGYKVRVITNANEAENNLTNNNWGYDDLSWLNFNVDETGGLLRTYFIEPSMEDGKFIGKHQHTPIDKMSQSKLYGLSLSVIKKYKSSVIISGYLEPYGAVAAELSKNYNIPMYQHFAGSDLERLSNIFEIGFRFKDVFSTSTLISTTWDKVARVLSMGVPIHRIIPIPAPTLLPEELFNSKGDYLYQKRDLSELVIGAYGKYNHYKGFEELLKAILLISQKGQKVKLLLILADEIDESNEIHKLIKELVEKELLILKSGIPPWKIPTFIRSCDAVCLLESGFPISTHAPITPLEIAMCGACPIFSEEMFNKIRIKGFKKDENCLVLEDPKDIAKLANIIMVNQKKIMNIKEKISIVGEENLGITSWDEYIKNIERLSILEMSNYEEKQNNLTSFTEKIYIIFCFFPLSLTYLKQLNQEEGINDWIRNYSYNSYDPIHIAKEFSVFLKSKMKKLDFFAREAILYESGKVECIFISNTLDCDKFQSDLTRINFIKEKENYEYRLRYIPIILTLNSNLVDCYNFIFHTTTRIKMTERKSYIFISTNGMSYKVLDLTEKENLFINALIKNKVVTEEEISGYYKLKKNLLYYNILEKVKKG